MNEVTLQDACDEILMEETEDFVINLMDDYSALFVNKGTTDEGERVALVTIYLHDTIFIANHIFKRSAPAVKFLLDFKGGNFFLPYQGCDS